MSDIRQLANAVGGKNLIVGGPFGSKLTQRDYAASGVPVIRGSNMGSGGRWVSGPFAFVSAEKVAQDLSSNLAFPGDIIVTQRGTMGQVAILPNDGEYPRYVISQSQMAIRVNSGLADPMFVYYYLSSPIFLRYIDLTTIQAGVPHINLGLLRDAPVQWPQVDDQRAIASILAALDDKIELNRRMNESLETAAQAIFKDWFVDFGPTRAKQEGRGPYLSSDIWPLFPSKLDDSAKPEGWQTLSVYEIANVIYGAPFASSKFNTRRIGQPLIRIRDLANERPSVWTTEVHPKGYKVKHGDIVVGMDGEFRAHLWGGSEAWLNQRVCVFTPKQGYSSAFVRNSILAPLAHIEATEIATTVIHLGKNDIDRFAMTIPNTGALSAFNRLVQPLYDRIVANKLEEHTLSLTRDLLLPKLISGQICVKDARKIAGEAI